MSAGTITEIIELILWAIASFLIASFFEYWLHRFMHQHPRLCKFHAEHHGKNAGQGVLGEFRDYIRGGFILTIALFLYSIPVGISWFIGMVGYAFFAAWAHQLQHEYPVGCFWMKIPIHYVHHKYNQWHHNFGLGVDWWDRVFGTYKPVDWLTETEINLPQRHSWQIKWW